MDNVNVRWFVNEETGSWVLQYKASDGWVKVPVVFKEKENEDN